MSCMPPHFRLRGAISSITIKIETKAYGLMQKVVCTIRIQEDGLWGKSFEDTKTIFATTLLAVIQKNEEEN